MRRPPLAVAALTTVALFTSCITNEAIGRRQLLLFGEDEMAQLGEESYEQATAEYPVITGTREARMVQQVAADLVRVAEYTDVPPEQWDFRLLDAPDTVNAFALPGGNVAVYSGLLRVADTPDQLAAVIGHEIAHVTADHGNERVSTAMVTQLGLESVAALLGAWEDGDETVKAVTVGALGLGAQYGVQMPFSRRDETEADMLGLRYMVRAGYDPYAAPKLWEEMAELGGSSLPEFLSTHPSSERRARELREAIPRIVEEEKGWQPGGTTTAP